MPIHPTEAERRLAALEAGIAQLSNRLTPEQRAAIGWTQSDGVYVPQRDIWNFPTAIVEDDPANGRTNVTLSDCITFLYDFAGTGTSPAFNSSYVTWTGPGAGTYGRDGDRGFIDSTGFGSLLLQPASYHPGVMAGTRITVIAGPSGAFPNTVLRLTNFGGGGGECQLEFGGNTTTYTAGRSYGSTIIDNAESFGSASSGGCTAFRLELFVDSNTGDVALAVRGLNGSPTNGLWVRNVPEMANPLAPLDGLVYLGMFGGTDRRYFDDYAFTDCPP